MPRFNAKVIFPDVPLARVRNLTPNGVELLFGNRWLTISASLTVLSQTATHVRVRVAPPVDWSR